MRAVSLTATTIAFGAALALLAPALARAQAQPSQPPGAPPPMTFRQALDLATAQNLELAAVRRARADSGGRGARRRASGPTPSSPARSPRTCRTAIWPIGLPDRHLRPARSKRVAVAKAGLAMADVDEANALRQLRRDTRLAFYGVLAADEQVALAETCVEVAAALQGRRAGAVRRGRGAAARRHGGRPRPGAREGRPGSGAVVAARGAGRPERAAEPPAGHDARAGGRGVRDAGAADARPRDGAGARHQRRPGRARSGSARSRRARSIC